MLDEACAELVLSVWQSVTSGFSSVASMRLRIPPLGAMLHGKAKKDTLWNSSTLEWSCLVGVWILHVCVAMVKTLLCARLHPENDAGVLRSRNLVLFPTI